MTDERRRRRHGRELEAAILDAAWEELVEAGYARLTVGSVAVRAQTSEPVLYRRWANKDELVLAAVGHYRDSHPIALPDTGGLRDDLIGYLTAVSRARAGYFAIALAAAFSGLLAGTGLTLAELRARFMDDHDRPVYQRAHDRGEIDLGRVPAAVLALPFELVRHDLLMGLDPTRPGRISSIVDEVFLPLLPGGPAREASAPHRTAPPDAGHASMSM